MKTQTTPISDQAVKQPSKLRRFLYGLSWSIIFPIVIAIPSFVIMLMILGAVLTSLVKNDDFNSTIANDGIFYLELYFFAFVTLLVIVLFLVKWLLRTRKRLFFRSGAKVLGVYIWVGIFATGLTMAFITRNPDAIKPPAEQDAHLMQVISAVGGDTAKLKDVSVKYVADYKDGFQNQAGEYMSYDDSKGNFSYGTLTVKQGLDVEEEKVVTAHEYLHHIWFSELDEQTQRELTSQLMTLYGQDDWFKTRVATYSDTNMLIPTELFSFYCTESSDQYLTPYVIEQCNKYINRGTLQFIR
jgi:hypothetical protein